MYLKILIMESWKETMSSLENFQPYGISDRYNSNAYPTGVILSFTLIISSSIGLK